MADPVYQINPQTPSDPRAPAPAHMLVAGTEKTVVHTNEFTVIALREGLLYASPPVEWGNGLADWGKEPPDEATIKEVEAKFKKDAEDGRKVQIESRELHFQEEKKRREERDKKDEERREKERKADEERRVREAKEREITHTEVKHTEVSHEPPHGVPTARPALHPVPRDTGGTKK